MINRYYKVFELLESNCDLLQELEKPTVIRQQMYSGTLFPSKAEIKRQLDRDINDSTREFEIVEVIAISD